MPKHIDTTPDRKFTAGPIKITLLKTTIYIYLFNGIIPWTKRQCSDERQAAIEFRTLQQALLEFAKPRKTKQSFWSRLLRRG